MFLWIGRSAINFTLQGIILIKPESCGKFHVLDQLDGCDKNTINLVTYNQQELWEVWDQGTGRFGVCWVLMIINLIDYD